MILFNLLLNFHQKLVENGRTMNANMGGYLESTYADMQMGGPSRKCTFSYKGGSKFLKILHIYYVNGPRGVKNWACRLDPTY